MTDVVTKAMRSRMMSGIRSKNTKPELMIRHGLHSRGLRYRLHSKRIPGKPDLVFPKYRAVIMIHGCFWHGHDCQLFRYPSSRADFWYKKIERNRERDREIFTLLTSSNWRILTIWECSLKGTAKLPIDIIIDDTINWLKSSDCGMDIRGKGKDG